MVRRIRWGRVWSTWPQPRTREMTMDISSLSNFSQQTVPQNSLWGTTLPRLLDFIPGFWSAFNSISDKELPFMGGGNKMYFLTVPQPYFPKPKILNAGPHRMDDWGFLLLQILLTDLCEKSLKSQIIKLHSIIYVKNYLFEEWNYRQRKQIQ